MNEATGALSLLGDDRASDALVERDLDARVARLEDDVVAALLRAVARLEDDLATARAEVTALTEAATVRSAAQRRALAAADARLTAQAQTLTWQAGELALAVWRNPLKWWRVPAAIWALRREAVRRGAKRRSGTVVELPAAALADLHDVWQRCGRSAAQLWLETWSDAPAQRAGGAAVLARQLLAHDPAGSLDVARLAYALQPQPARAKWLTFRLFDGGVIAEAVALLDALPPDALHAPGDAARAGQIRGAARMAAMLAADPALGGLIPPRHSPPEPGAAADRLLYVCASSLPFHTTGYALRSQALLKALRRAGAGLSVVTRPGYPWDRRDRSGEPAPASVVDGIRYQHLPEPDAQAPLDQWVGAAAGVLEGIARADGVGVIQAASNHVNALPALVAARRLGLPFHYEVRGLWELSRAAKVPGYDQTERGRLGLGLEAAVARAADRILVISAPLAARLIADWGLDPARVTVVPNGIDPAEFTALAGPAPAEPTIGYAGALVGYEGLDLLLDAMARLRDGGTRVCLDLIGQGEARPALEVQARRLGLAGQVRWIGAVPVEEARARLAACTMVCLPRRPSEVCELVPPLKLVEALALGVPVVVPDLPVFLSEVVPDRTARVYAAGDADDLARAIAGVLADPAAALAMARRARTDALTHRTWAAAAQVILPAAATVPVGRWRGFPASVSA